MGSYQYVEKYALANAKFEERSCSVDAGAMFRKKRRVSRNTAKFRSKSDLTRFGNIPKRADSLAGHNRLIID